MRVLELRDPPSPTDACELFLDLPHCALLESVGEHGDLARHSFLGADPFLFLESHGRELGWSRDGGTRIEEGDPFAALDQELARWRGATAVARSNDAGHLEGSDASRLPPFRGGVMGYFGYDLLHHLERVLAPRFADLRLPDLAVGFYDWVVAWDHVTRRAWIVSTGFPEQDEPARDARAAARLGMVKDRLAGASPMAQEQSAGASPLPQDGGAPVPPSHEVAEVPGLRSTFSREGYLRAVERAREYILAGDIFQVNLSQRLALPSSGEPFDLYRRLRRANPAPFAAFLAGREAAVLSASPERFLRLSGAHVETRPIKGTTGRGYTPAHDFALADDLFVSEKDRAENVMIVDLLRNDLSRVAVDGSVRVPDLWRVEHHPTVHHLVSTVTAQLRPDVSTVDLLRATFPGGSVTGAPKIRAMEIIYELEPTRRDVYCGSIGYIGFDGEADLSIAIRTVTWKDGVAYFSVGGAVVVDSDPAAEYRETLLKAAGLLRAWQRPPPAAVRTATGGAVDASGEISGAPSGARA